MMKIINKILYGLASIALLAGCSLDKEPFTALTNESIENTPGALEALNLGNYQRLKSWVENWHRVTEYPGDNVALSGTTTDNLFYNYNYQRIVNNGRVNSYWENSYRIIAGVNSLLAQVEEGTDAATDQIIAENLYLRGMMYFYLVNVFGRPYNQDPTTNLAVPLQLSADPFEVNARNTVAEVYAQIEQDLLRAEQLFTNYRGNIYGSIYAAQALLARVYLYTGDNASAIEYANKVLNAGQFSLLSGANYTQIATAAPENNPETIFAIKFVQDIDYPDNGWYTIGSMYATIDGAGWGEMYASRSYLEEVRKYPEDVRYNFIRPVVVNENELHAYYVTDNYQYASVIVTQNGSDYMYTDGGTTRMLTKRSNGAGAYQYFITIAGRERSVLIDRRLDNRNGHLKYFILKCSGQQGQAHLWSPVILRLSEMYLVRAEANAKLGNTAAALEDVNVIRRRAGIPAGGLWTTANLDGKTALDVVLAERKLEFAWEGHRKFDVFRNGYTLDRRYPGTHIANTNSFLTVEPSSTAIVEFIPEQQIVLSNGILTQNQ
ncbi:RagB/SusD family nutrient uptake outer membrane protein [Sphingobacterium oryzagri]|uniref:RagB/SusD family nutrient uptake outer membrane protein n=1 Tax=Sphingobacterium oryzagri TaxID=3025669 RepID=A0ABY7WIK8_9SPHI|nr:RagB/SusD family nutrient uptake outer membrane protein [Sphingobacterium sp. KACC 22765]WDF69457.1 RagB/SusD family nutrient uptake outer membrane protein [Sphingobacterium sp. KACC 22765]